MNEVKPIDPQELVHGLGADLQEDLVLVTEVHVERGRGDADLVGDLTDRRAFIAAFDEYPLGGALPVAVVVIASTTRFFQ